MSVYVIGFGMLESNEFNETEWKKILKMFEKQKEHFNNINLGDSGIEFRMSGNHDIDYEPLDKIKKEILKLGSPFRIGVNEFVEGEEAYYFDTEED